MGYPRFGAMWALILVRLCIGTPFSWDSPELLLMVLVFLSEVVEDDDAWHFSHLSRAVLEPMEGFDVATFLPWQPAGSRIS